jgi:hypothetical protein
LEDIMPTEKLERLAVNYRTAGLLLDCAPSKIAKLVAAGILTPIDLNAGMPREDGTAKRPRWRIPYEQLVKLTRRPE